MMAKRFAQQATLATAKLPISAASGTIAARRMAGARDLHREEWA